jgi:hypothetical protein
MSQRNIVRWIFTIAWIVTFMISIANCGFAIWGMNFSEINPDNTVIVCNGITYGEGMGSISFLARLMGIGVIGLMGCIMSAWIFPTYMHIHKFKDERRS